MHCLPSNGVLKRELFSMQSLAQHASSLRATVDAVCHQGVANMRHVNPNLMGSTRM